MVTHTQVPNLLALDTTMLELNTHTLATEYRCREKNERLCRQSLLNKFDYCIEYMHYVFIVSLVNTISYMITLTNRIPNYIKYLN